MGEAGREIAIRELAALVDGTIHGNDELVIKGIAPLDVAQPNDVSFLTKRRYIKAAMTTRAGCIIVGKEVVLPERTVILVAKPRLAYVKAMQFFFPGETHQPWISHEASIAESVSLGSNIRIEARSVVGPRCRIGSGTSILAGSVISSSCKIGENCTIHPGVVIYPHTELGDRVIVHANTVLGSDGFGFYLDAEQPIKIPQIGKLIIEDDVEIGPNTCVERATLSETRIGSRVKIGGLVYIGHNVRIGDDTVIIGQCGISGSTTIGRGCRIWGQVGIRGHLAIGDRALILARSFVTSSVPDGAIFAGEPAMPHLQWKRIISSLKRLPELVRTHRVERSVD